MVATIDEKEIHLGRGEITSKLLRFQYAYERELNAYWSEVERIDLRYPNSLSVDKGQIKETRGLL